MCSSAARLRVAAPTTRGPRQRPPSVLRRTCSSRRTRWADVGAKPLANALRAQRAPPDAASTLYFNLVGEEGPSAIADALREPPAAHPPPRPGRGRARRAAASALDVAGERASPSSR